MLSLIMALTELVIIGDSLSSPEGCQWPTHITKDYAYVRNFAQMGMTTAAFDFPDHLAANKHADRNIAVVYIGTNDAGSGLKAAGYGERMRELVMRLEHRNYETYVVRLPVLDVHTDAIRAYNAVLDGMFTEPQLIDPGWGSEVTVDRVHPTCGAHGYLAGWFIWKLEL